MWRFRKSIKWILSPTHLGLIRKSKMVHVRIEKTDDKNIVVCIDHRKLTFKEDKVEIHENDSDDFELRFCDDSGLCIPYKIGFNFNTIRGHIVKSECGVYNNMCVFLCKKNVIDLFRPFEFTVRVSEEMIRSISDALKKKAVHIGTENVDFDTDNNMCIASNEIYSLTEAPAGVLYG